MLGARKAALAIRHCCEWARLRAASFVTQALPGKQKHLDVPIYCLLCLHQPEQGTLLVNPASLHLAQVSKWVDFRIPLSACRIEVLSVFFLLTLLPLRTLCCAELMA
jgi:hypothetical protein